MEQPIQEVLIKSKFSQKKIKEIIRTLHEGEGYDTSRTSLD